VLIVVLITKSSETVTKKSSTSYISFNDVMLMNESPILPQ